MGVGSSPQVRGILLMLLEVLMPSRIIPAGAGHLMFSCTTAKEPGDHPRRCGAFDVFMHYCQRTGGSSPQVRGISEGACPTSGAIGIIPAGAGHLARKAGAPPSSWDHPRRCGAFSCGAVRGRVTGGSSPQVRGISGVVAFSTKAFRIIPAGAGHLPRPAVPYLPRRDHPRRCGAFAL